MEFIDILKIPESGDPYFNTTASGGYSTAIKGKNSKTGTFHAGLNVLPNCVGLTFGLVNKIAGDTKMRILQPVNAENWVEIAQKQGLKIGTEPKLGAVMCWQKGKTLSGTDGAGHVCVVGKIIDKDTVITAESGYNSALAFGTQTRKRGNGNWGQSSSYTFRGFIYPEYCDKFDVPEENHLYRIRKKWTDVKSQIGAYRILDNAKKACLAGYTVFDEHGSVMYSVPDVPASPFKVGDMVKIKAGASDYTGHKLAKFVYDRVYVISEISGNRAVIKYTGVVIAAMKVSDLIHV